MGTERKHCIAFRNLIAVLAELRLERYVSVTVAMAATSTNQNADFFYSRFSNQ